MECDGGRFSAAPGLVVEDERPIRELVRLHLELGGFDVDEVGDGTEGARAGPGCGVRSRSILDVMLPGSTASTLCRRASRRRARTGETPILMLTARDAESDKVVGLESGADDYLTKPFGVRELMARVGAITRRQQRAAAEGGTTAASRRLTRPPARPRQARGGGAGQVSRADPQEFDLLHQLASRPGIVFSRAALLPNVWSDDSFVTERTVDTVISRLRRKIERDRAGPGADPDRVGRRLQVRGCGVTELQTAEQFDDCRLH